MRGSHIPWLDELGHSPWFFLVFVVFFMGVMWPLTLTLLSRLCGHQTLLARYPPLDEPMDESFGWASGHMRGVSFRSALYVGLGQRGLHLAPNGMFRPPFSRGIPCIPWEELRCIRAPTSGLLGFFRGSQFEVVSLGLRFTLLGAAGRALAQRLGTS